MFANIQIIQRNPYIIVAAALHSRNFKHDKILPRESSSHAKLFPEHNTWSSPTLTGPKTVVVNQWDGGKEMNQREEGLNFSLARMLVSCCLLSKVL